MFQLPGSLAKKLALLGLTFFYVPAGAMHFLKTDFYLSIMPPYLPQPLALVYISGVAEILGVLPVVTRRWAGFGLVALLVAVAPANIHMAMYPERYASVASTTALWLRLPMQLVLIVWALWATSPGP